MSDTSIKRNPFPKVAEAREAIKAKALAMADLYEKAIKDAMAAGEYEAALKAMQWFLEHTPSHDGISVIDAGVDSKAAQKGPAGPKIQIGIKLDGMGAQPKELPAITVIDIEPEDEPSES